MQQLELPMKMDGMMSAADLQDALGAAVLHALDGAFQQGMPVAIASISFEGLDGDGTVTVNAVTADGQKFEAEVEVMEPESDAEDMAEGGEGAEAAPAADAAPAPQAGA